MRQNLILASIVLAALAASMQPAHAGPFCMMTSVNQGEPICNFRSWAQCRANLGGMGDYCYANTLGPYVFDMSDAANPRVVTGKPPAKAGKRRQ